MTEKLNQEDEKKHQEKQNQEHEKKQQENPPTCTIRVKCYSKRDNRYYPYRTHEFTAEWTKRKMYDVISTFDRDRMRFPDPDDEDTVFSDSVAKRFYQINEEKMPAGKNYVCHAYPL